MTDKPCYSVVLRAPYRAALEHGLPTQKLFLGTGLDKAVLDDAYQIIGRNQALAFYKNLVALAEPGIGLDAGLATSLTEMGSHGHMDAAVDTIRTSIVLGQRFYDIIYLHLDWEAETRGDLQVYRFTEKTPLGDARQFCIDRLLTAMQVRAEYFGGAGLKPLLVTLDRPEPVYSARYQEIFQAPIRYSQDAVELHYSSEALDHKVSSYDPKVLEVMTALCESLQQKLNQREDIVSEVRRAINLKSNGFPNIEQVAESLSCSPRTLRRKLQQQKENFQKILDEERERVALDYLCNSELTMQQISERCGFRDAQNFSHAFRRWSGFSPTQFRKNSQ